MSSQGSSNGSTYFSVSSNSFPSYISVLGDDIKIHDFPSLLDQISSELFSPDHPIWIWAQTTTRALSIFNILTDESYTLLKNPKVASGKGIVGKIYKMELTDGISCLTIWSDWAIVLRRCKKIIDDGANGRTNFIQGEVLLHLLFVDGELAKVMERVERYNRKYGPIIQSVKMEIQGCVRPIKGTDPNEAVTTKRPTDDKPALKAEAVPKKPEREEVERAPLWMLALFLLVLVLAIRGTASMLSSGSLWSSFAKRPEQG